ncbi:MAG: hypothetical protein WCE79_29825 [Xanthobacteraceae bacterium]
MADEPIKRVGMYGWYDPGHLLETGIRVGIAGIFGEFLDRRELFANRLTAEPALFDDAHDYSAHAVKPEGLWIDFVADTGDGWDPTYAVARLLARRGLRFRRQGDVWAGVDDGSKASGDTIETRRGKVLIFGGDQVYSTASYETYRARFDTPFEQAARIEGVEDELKQADVYALPGNHDWYDGLNAFISMFVTRRPGGPKEGFGAGREITCRVARQTRSYFAIKLSDDWWLLGADAQLSGYIDQGQIAFFDDLAQTVMKPGSNIILCAAKPSWSYVGLDGPPEKIFRNHGYLEDMVTGLMRENGRRHNLRLVLTGDAHHYARYMEWRGGARKEDRAASYTEIAQDARCYLTWGGGGAFLHPTHMLQDVKFTWNFPPPPPVSPLDVTKETAIPGRSFDLKLIYPNETTSRRLARNIPLFGFNNYQFSWLMFAFSLVVTWALAGTAGLRGEYLPRSLRDGGKGLLAAAGDLAFLLSSFPWVLLMCLALTAALAYFSAAQTKPKRWLYGFLHFTAYLVSYFLVFLLLARSIEFKSYTWLEPVVLVLAVSGVMWFVAPLIMGLYLWLSLRLRLHWNEAFSSLRLKNHKGFLRLHIKDGSVTIYPIAMDTVPDGGDGPLQTRLIERPIRISGTA